MSVYSRKTLHQRIMYPAGEIGDGKIFIHPVADIVRMYGLRSELGHWPTHDLGIALSTLLTEAAFDAAALANRAKLPTAWQEGWQTHL